MKEKQSIFKFLCCLSIFAMTLSVSVEARKKEQVKDFVIGNNFYQQLNKANKGERFVLYFDDGDNWVITSPELRVKSMEIEPKCNCQFFDLSFFSNGGKKYSVTFNFGEKEVRFIPSKEEIKLDQEKIRMSSGYGYTYIGDANLLKIEKINSSSSKKLKSKEVTCRYLERPTLTNVYEANNKVTSLCHGPVTKECFGEENKKEILVFASCLVKEGKDGREKVCPSALECSNDKRVQMNYKQGKVE